METIFKYHGLGNDFVLLDRRERGADIDATASRRLCDRRRGVGADGVLVLLPSQLPGAVARMVVHNADGSVAEMCGNGVRCAAKYLADRTTTDCPASMAIETGAGLLECGLSYAGGEVAQVQVSMGPAFVGFVDRPLTTDAAGTAGAPRFLGTAVSLGNPHLVLFDAPPERAAELGPLLELNPLFPNRTNVEFVTVSQGRASEPSALPEPGALSVVVWERGAGLTQACGTGACAAAVAAALRGQVLFGEWLGVNLPGGKLEVRVGAGLRTVDLRGPAEFVFEAIVPRIDSP